MMRSWTVSYTHLADHGEIKRCVHVRKAVAQKKISRREELIGM